MSELTKFNKVWCWMEQCQVGENLWVKADEAEQQIAYWKRCVETSKGIHQQDNETIRKLQKGVHDWKDAYYTINSDYGAMHSQSLISEREAKEWKFCGICCFVIALAEAIFIGVKLL